MSCQRLTHRFVDTVPEQLEPGILYVSIEFATVMHLCCCGCGNEVVTPLSPTDWKLTFDGESISLHPSIGNWSFPCRSHYWIRQNRIEWALQWSDEQIQENRERDLRQKLYGGPLERKDRGEPPLPSTRGASQSDDKLPFLQRLLCWIRKHH